MHHKLLGTFLFQKMRRQLEITEIMSTEARGSNLTMSSTAFAAVNTKQQTGEETIMPTSRLHQTMSISFN
jgi:hypothetical protein